MTIFDEWRLEGKIEGKIEGEIKGKIEVIEKMINMGMDWQTIYQITGIDDQQFDEMKIKLHQLSILPNLAEHEMAKHMHTAHHSAFSS
ncbi:MAG: hypothetical protein HQK75_19115 [Candidatus Magnetomorum sp.]|nr:hypothetical protein [Candidatus Magnetomorum sp.]